ncbi:MAG: Crp/Fnr family transcriptional regulator [Candidatus Dormibacteria bacterium]
MSASEQRAALDVDPAAVLLSTHMFSDLTAAEVEPLARAAVVRRYGRGEHIFDVGDTADSMLVVVSGQGRDSLLTADGDEFMYAMWEPGMIVGEVGVFAPDHTRLMAFIAVQPTVLLALPRADLMPFLLRHPIAMQRALEVVASHARALRVQLVARSMRPLRERVLLHLLELAEAGPPRADGSAVTPPVSQSMLSTMAGVTRENVNRALATLIAEGVVRAESGAYVVSDRVRAWREVTGGGPEVGRPNRGGVAQPDERSRRL